MILIIDNYDSFVYNLSSYCICLGYDTIVIRNDEITVELLTNLQPTHIIISPGPKDPSHCGNCLSILDYCYDKLPILGVCLGHQLIGYYFGLKIVVANKPMHGVSSLIKHDCNSILFNGIESEFFAARYHSLVVVPSNDKYSSIKAIAYSEDNDLMALEHIKYNIFGVQFHPESILTKCGKKILMNFLKVNN